MNTTRHERNMLLLLSTVAIVFVVVSIGCLQSNKSKIVGNWKVQSIDNTDGSVKYTLYKFHKEGGVSKSAGIIINDQLSKPKIKMIGKYKFEKGNKKISITWDDGTSETINVGFPQKNKMLLGEYELERIMK